MRFLLLFLFLLGIQSGILSGQEMVRPVDTHGRLSVSGKNLLNQHGEIVVLRGISLSWSIWQGQKYYNKEVVNWLIDDFKINLLRVSMAIEPDGGYLDEPEKQMALITEVVDAALNRGIYVLLDWHDHNAHKNVEVSKAFFGKISAKYAGMPNLIYEIWNEPERVDWPTVKTYAEALIPVIRANDPNSLIVVGCPHWDQDVNIVAKDRLRDDKNILYAFHFYASDPNHQTVLRKRASMAIENGLPLIVSEWGVGESDGNGVFDLEKTNTWMKWMDANQLSWANWNLTDKAETTAILLKGASTKGQWQDTDLSPAGRYIREVLRKEFLKDK